ncbi:hypothetical protein MPTK1_7g14180 [Marchantia polymorpha subsp. ruderalis]|uniref:Uncharacterized protein n=2 Tax=Marchantia polymorpha TaxID=3197 RepID=A0AAF6BZG0_MARPO|nr:hypothetical protein MARPO_0009s0103 [Marchantia polymorpha]BBN17394.1 hypothetical protein Mp_7g14180 [Marchantia polymorpha subsp. ruderalis]|eukprot:PTQ46999.1 hypothetical protein MARPO_0009s0103 [Marchantia polymorpha]
MQLTFLCSDKENLSFAAHLPVLALHLCLCASQLLYHLLRSSSKRTKAEESFTGSSRSSAIIHSMIMFILQRLSSPVNMFYSLLDGFRKSQSRDREQSCKVFREFSLECHLNCSCLDWMCLGGFIPVRLDGIFPFFLVCWWDFPNLEMQRSTQDSMEGTRLAVNGQRGFVENI